MMRRRTSRHWSSVALMALAMGVAASGGGPMLAVAGTLPVVGTVRVSGQVERAVKPAAWEPLNGGPLLDGTDLRTGGTGLAVIQFANGDSLAVGRDTRCWIGERGIALESGRVALKLHPGSAMTVETPTGLVRQPTVVQAAAGPQEVVVAVEDGRTAIRAVQGQFELQLPDGRRTPIGAGDVATATLGEQDVVLAAATTSLSAAEGTAAKAGGLSLPFGMSKLTASLLTAGIVTGGAVGGAAAGGAFSGGGSSSSPATGGGQASPFRPTRR